MRRVSLLATALLLTASSALAQGEPPKPAEKPAEKPAATQEGKWSGAVSTEQGSQEVWVVIKKETDGKYSGTAGSQMGETPLYDIKITGDTLVAGATLSTPNGNFDLWYSLLLKDDTLSGSIDLNVQGQKMSFPVSFKRQP